MENVRRINRNLFNIYLLFTRDPFVRYFTKELEFYATIDSRLLGLITLDLTDNDFSCIIFSRDSSKQYRAEKIEVSIDTIDKARGWLIVNMNNDSVVHHDNKTKLFDLFEIKVKSDKIHPYFKMLNESPAFAAAKDVIREISYHYKDIDGNFIDQFQSLNGFDSRLWELYLFCFCREELFSFKRNSHSPDFIIEKFAQEIAIEAVIVSRDIKSSQFNGLDEIKSQEQIDELLMNEMPLKFGSSLYDKLKKQYWKLPHVQGKPFLIAIADFHEDFAMTWSFPAIIDYLFGTRYSYYHNDSGELIINPEEIKEFTKKTGAKVPAGFFFQPDSENVSAIIFSSIATLSKFNRIGKQAGLGTSESIIIRVGACYNHDENASKANFFQHTVNEDCNEFWSEGVSIFHNPNAKYPLNKELFPSVAHHVYREGLIYSDNPDFFPYNSFNYNMITKK